MTIFRRFASKNSTKPGIATTASPALASPSVDANLPDSFEVQHKELDVVEKRLEELRSRQASNDEAGSILPSAGRINEVDLRTVIDLTEGEDMDFERRFEAFAEHAADMRARGWIDR